MTTETNNTQTEKKPGTVRIALSVLVTIIEATAVEVPGVLRLGGTVNKGRFFNRDGNEGIKVEVHNGAVKADIHMVVSREANMLQVGKKVQADVSKAVRYMVGMPVEQINVYIQNVE